jgi:hypothetical protein
MSLSFSYLLTVFVNLSKQPIRNEIEVTDKYGKFISFLNDTYLKPNYPDLELEHASQYTTETLEEVENNILHCNITTEFKTVYLTYAYNSDKTFQGPQSHKVDITVKDGAKLYEMLTAIDCLIRGYKIEECNDGIIITTPTNNKRTIRYNQSWYCDCNEYSNYYTCQHIKLANTYLSHRLEFNK